MRNVDLVIIGAGPVGLMSAFLAQQCGMSTLIVDKSNEPLRVGRADALNARTLQLLEIAGLFDALYEKGKPCNTSSIWAGGKFTSRQSHWWDDLQGCFHKHFLMLGQSFIEQLLDEKLNAINAGAIRQTEVKDIQLIPNGCTTSLSNGEIIQSSFVIGADGSRSYVRNLFSIPFEITRPQITWAVIDAVIKTDFPKVPEIIVFQTETSDVAWIPREGKIDRFYVRMDTKNFTMDQALERIKRAMQPHSIAIEELIWFSQFSVKESVAERFSVHERIFLAGDSCHIHSVNGGQGLNTGLADAFNLIWKLNNVLNHKAPTSLLQTYEAERKPVALSVVETSGELVRATKFSENSNHAEDYIKIVEKKAGNITGMGIAYSADAYIGQRLYDFEVIDNGKKSRVYSLLDYAKHTLIVRGKLKKMPQLQENIQLLEIGEKDTKYISASNEYKDKALLVRPDGYIARIGGINNIESLLGDFNEI